MELTGIQLIYKENNRNTMDENCLVRFSDHGLLFQKSNNTPSFMVTYEKMVHMFVTSSRDLFMITIPTKETVYYVSYKGHYKEIKPVFDRIIEFFTQCKNTYAQRTYKKGKEEYFYVNYRRGQLFGMVNVNDEDFALEGGFFQYDEELNFTISYWLVDIRHENDAFHSLKVNKEDIKSIEIMKHKKDKHVMIHTDSKWYRVYFSYLDVFAINEIIDLEQALFSWPSRPKKKNVLEYFND